MTWDISKQVFMALIRWVIAFIGFRLVEAGIIDAATAEAWGNEIALAGAGFVVLAIPIIWKYLNAKFHILALITAVQTDPPADTPREVKQAVEAVKAEVKANNTVAAS